MVGSESDRACFNAAAMSLFSHATRWRCSKEEAGQQLIEQERKERVTSWDINKIFK